MIKDSAKNVRNNGSNVKIAISGKSGCGNTTVCRLAAEKLGLRFINFTFRTLATEHGITLEEVIRRAAGDDYWDKEVDRRQVELARKVPAPGSGESVGCVLGSRLAIWMLDDADLKVYLDADFETRTRRILVREGGNAEDVARFTRLRDSEDSARYKRIYGIDNDDYSFADLVIDAARLSPEEIVEALQAHLRTHMRTHLESAGLRV